MTCLVSAAAEGLHVHFIDGGDGGYTEAATRMKAARAAAAGGSDAAAVLGEAPGRLGAS